MSLAEDYPPAKDLPPREGLPQALVMFDGASVDTPEDWYSRRRPELLQLFRRYVYGVAPAVPRVEFREDAPPVSVLDGAAVLKQIEIRFPELPAEAPSIHLAIFLPAGPGPHPVFVALNSGGNQEVVADEAVRSTRHEANEPTPRGARVDFWCVDYQISRGYGFATFHQSDVDPDEHDFSDGIHPFYPELDCPPESRWGTIAAWAWGLQRAVDYLATDEAVDSAAIAVTGHSRRGKTALWAGASDERFALVVPHQSGTGGAALSRSNDQETVERINRVFPHWFCDAFTEFNDDEARLPVDQHLLAALVAPRALLDTAGDQDTWANYESALRGLKEADRVYKFLGEPGMVGSGVIRDEAPLVGDGVGTLAQYRRNERHTLNRDYWRAILDFADQQFGQ